MPQVINTNISSLTAQRNLNSSAAAQQQAMQRLSSGLRINSAKDDAAGVGISARFEAQTRGMNVAIRNANDGVSLAQTAEGALGTVIDNLQRIRELALQASNGTNSRVDREALDAEAQQLIQEIQRSTAQTNFNGINLLNGDFKDRTFQLGANVGEDFSFSIPEMSINILGTGEDVGVSGTGNSNALVPGDLIINGVAIGSSLTADDNASSSNKNSSGIAKAAAINRVSDVSGVVAEPLETVVAGTVMVLGVATGGNATINGIVINIDVGNVSNAANRAAVITAINAQAGLTGVSATDSGLDSGGVVLTAADGRNIDIGAFGTPLTAANSGLGTTGTTGSGFTLRSVDGREIVIEGGAGDLTNSGLVEGTFTPGKAFVASSAPTAAPLVAGDVIINGVTIGASLVTDDTSSSANKSASAIAKAAAINRNATETGVTATPNPTDVPGTAMVANTLSGGITINGVTTSILSTDVADSEASRQSAINAINAISGQTGVIAIDTGANATGINLKAEDGRNIVLAFTGALTAAATGLPVTATYFSTFTLESAGKIDITGGTGTLANSGLQVGGFGGTNDGITLSQINLGTIDGAQDALTAIDNALDSVNSQRADLGAVQNRLISTVASLEIAAENLTAAKSRIIDADFALETAQLSRAQVLQQAGISMLAQANATPQQVLSLLQ